MMIKFCLGVAIVALTSFIGYLLSKKYRQRKDFFIQLCTFNDRYLSELAYRRRPIREFASSYVYYGEFNALLQEFFLGIEEGADFNFPDYNFLSKEEKTLITDYFLMLGRGDSFSQKGYFSSLKETISSHTAKVTEDGKRYGDLYIKIGFLCGLLILILII